MKIAIFHNDKNRDTALAIGKIITAHSVNVVYCDTDTIWDRKLTKNPLGLMDHVSHFLFVYSQDVSDLSSPIFFAGYCLGKGIRVLVLETDAHFHVPENCQHLVTFLKPESFEDFFVAEKVRFMETDRKERARRELLERGISCFEDNFLLIIGTGDTEAVGLFLDAGFSPDLTDSKGIPALSIAVRAQVPEVVEMLIKAGADINRLSGDRGYSPLMDAVQKGDSAMAELLIKGGADLDLRSKDGQTALVISVGRGAAEMAAMLVANGANPDIADHLGMSASGYAKLFKNEKMMDLFNIPRA